jgi:threonine dehydrogenase-like Zn-dependent dehydrogenase
MEELYGQRISAMFGYSHLTGGVPGCQAEYVRVPYAEMNCLKIPDDVPDEKALYLSDIVGTSYHGTELGQVKEGSTVAIWGLGPVGLLTARWCQIRKAKRIIGIDCVPERLEVARKMGIEIIDYKKHDTTKTLLAMVPGGVDTSIECVGFEWTKSWLSALEYKLGMETDTSDILKECITCTRKAGIVSIIGVYVGTTNHFPIGALMEKSLHVTGGQSFTQKYWKMCLEKIRKGEFDPTIAVSHKAKLSNAPELYKKFYNREDGVIKLFLRPDGFPQSQ